ncbi:hypothetical protein D3C85_1235670 [compost metagenome]
MVTANKGSSFKIVSNPKAIETAITFEMIKARVTFLEITSKANKIPAIGLLNKAVTPAATPAQISSVLY